MLERMRFNGVWRDYQARVLDVMNSHLGDERLHLAIRCLCATWTEWSTASITRHHNACNAKPVTPSL